MSWTPYDKIQQHDEKTALVNKIINAQLAVTDSSFGLAAEPTKVEKLESS